MSATPPRRPGVQVGGRVAKHGRRFEDKVARRASGVEYPDLPWDQIWITPIVAAERGIVTYREYAELVGVDKSSVLRWSKSAPKFPSPCCMVRPEPPRPGRSIGFYLDSIIAWHRWAYHWRHVTVPPPDSKEKA